MRSLSHTHDRTWDPVNGRQAFAIGDVYSPHAHPFSTTLAVRALSARAEHLPRAARDAEDAEATLACQRPAEMGDLALLNATSGLADAVEYQLGAARVSHEGTSRVMLPQFMGLFADAAPDRWAWSPRRYPPIAVAAARRSRRSRGPRRPGGAAAAARARRHRGPGQLYRRRDHDRAPGPGDSPMTVREQDMRQLFAAAL